ncbi:MAG: TolC family outer membrane protein [Gallionellaceae bacterium]|nr:TolC family outer membrane protein [Gallionellaceae bacterium]
MRKIKILLAALTTIGATHPAISSDLLETYHAAQSQDAVIAAARAARRAGQEKLAQGRSLLLPSVNLSANSTYNDSTIQYKNNFFFPSGTNRYNSSGYGVNLVQPLYNRQNWTIYSESELQVLQSDAQFGNAEQDLILRVAQAYFDILMAQDNVQLAEAQKIAISEQLEQAKRNFEVGTSTITDTHEAQARHDLTNAQEIAARNNLEIKKRTLQQLTNAMPSGLRQLGQQFKPEMPQTSDMEKWVDEAQQHNLQLVVAQAAAELAEKEVVRNHAGHYPTLDLVANHSQSYANGSNYGVGSDNRTTAIGVQLNLPLYQGGAIQSRLREAEANRDRAREELENVRRNIALQVRQAYLGVVDGVAQVKALQQALKSSESVLEASKLGQEVGVRTNLDVLNAQQQLYSTRRDLYQAEYSYLVSQLRLKAAAGTLSEDDLTKVNQALYQGNTEQELVRK